jgi:peptidase M24-like protein
MSGKVLGRGEVTVPVASRQDLAHPTQEPRGVGAVDGSVVESEGQHPHGVNTDRLGPIRRGDHDGLAYDGVGGEDRDLRLERPILSRMISLDHPEVLEEGMVFALETYWPAKDGWSAARIEEEVVVTATGCEVITKFPAEELLVAGQRYFSAGGPVNGLRESQSNLNTAAGRGEGSATT